MGRQRKAKEGNGDEKKQTEGRCLLLKTWKPTDISVPLGNGGKEGQHEGRKDGWTEEQKDGRMDGW